jgi:signal transduction histidine kinase
MSPHDLKFQHEVKILMVDDRSERLLSYEVALAGLGYTLVRAQSGKEALGKLMMMEFAAILLDVSMPEMDGFETAELIRNHPRFEDTPIIFVTGLHLTDLDQRKGYAMGAVDYIQIPVIPEILRGKVQALVQLYLQRVELIQLNQKLAVANTDLAKAHEELKAQNMRELQLLNHNLEQANVELQAANAKLTQEIAERERAEQALSQSIKRKDQYIAVLAHELRNPLSAIHNAVMVMQLPTASSQQRDWAQDLLQRQVKHLTCLMDDLLDVSRISNGRIQLRMEVVDLESIVRHAADTLAPLLQKHRHQLRLTLPQQPLFVQGDTVRLTQVLGNLLTNAAKYMDDGGLVELSLEADGAGCACIRVKDHGVGIPADLLLNVFDFFVQAPSALNRAQGGLGIGLALVRALVELHGGRVTAASEGVGCGAVFTVALPLVGQMPATTPADALAGGAAVTPLRILLIDDNADSASGLAQCLESLGHAVRISHSGKEGIAAVHRHSPDIVLLDIGLPDLDGYEVAQRLRQDKSHNELRIIAMTGFSGEANRSRARQAGFDHYLVKPVNFEELINLLTREALASGTQESDKAPLATP